MQKRFASPLVLAAVAILIAMVVPAVLASFGGWSGWHAGMMGPGWMWFMPVFMIAFWASVIWAVVVFVRGIARTSGAELGPAREESALEVLKRRYAKGEIGKEEYEEKKRDIS